MDPKLTEWGKGIAGAIIGGIIGHFAFDFLLGYGLYAGILPGALVGVGASYLRTTKNTAIGIMAAVLALIVGVYNELDAFTFGDGTLAFFLQNPQPAPWLMLGIGAALGTTSALAELAEA